MCLADLRKQLIMTPEVFSGRRLDSCNDLEVQVTEWKCLGALKEWEGCSQMSL